MQRDARVLREPVEQSLFDCEDPSQRFTCAEPVDPDERFVCHATPTKYVKISVDRTSPAHVPGESHGNGRVDQAPGASANDVGNGAGLDCECAPRVCADTCTGAADGTECDDADKCTGNGVCSGGTCQSGAPNCVAGSPIDACNAQNGVCDPDTGACFTSPEPAGTTCGTESQCDDGGVCVAIDVVINEAESSGGSPGDWVELYNAGTTTAHVGGWQFRDNDNTHTYTLAAGTTIAPGAYLVLDEATFGFGLGGADSTRLFDSAGVLVDSYAWTAHAATTYGRCPNGTGAFRTTTTVTKGAANDCTVTIAINEIESSGGSPGDWVELFNYGPIAVDVSGWRFKDNDDSHTFAIAPGTSIAPGAYLVLDEAQFGFGLGAADSARLYDASGALVDSHAWTTHAVTTYGRCPNGTGAFRATTSVSKGTANDCSTPIAINEIESSGGSPGDWVELYNNSPVAVDVSGWTFKDNNDANAYVIAGGTIVAAGAYLVLDEAQFGFGLGSADSARIFDATGALVDSHTWTAHAAITYGRCPSGTGAFTTTAASTKGAANSCSGGPPPAAAWPGQNTVTTVDAANTFGTNLSGLFYDGTDLWAVRNGPSTLFRLAFNGVVWARDDTATWTLRYPDGTGEPDAEDVAKAELTSSAIYVVTERDNAVSGVSRPSILRFDPSAGGGNLAATHEWNLAADLPVVGANLGLEAITWIPDSALVAAGFFDEAANTIYNPASYPNHGNGLFFVGLEANGAIYAYALDHVTGGFTRVATITSGDAASKALAYDRETGYLWQHCGAGCAGQSRVLMIGATGRFTSRATFARPATMDNLANEGIAIAPESQCVGGFKSYFWSDDGQAGGHAIRKDSIPCGSFIAP